ncbi:MJ1255/VC2487 family glycosyltransferase [Aliiglaciecola lipolytica]|uniref:Glycosyl transferase n=1 Tax=Aliiglaciecola lipolytica E3 TaxID=1127673 RepID=K6YFW2_9ALTE|nr:MJ1255/VC2487 family glycosyltransferase [Aliiglaciecola lipolytica]GAC15523.1 glycosyl transferase [Aliiglaciecola lipolytica E3]
MKILYGVQGTGNGHIARARIMAKAFAKREDIEVDFIFSGRDPAKYFDMEVFGNYRTVSGLTFITENGEVNRWKTLKQANIREFIRDVKQLNVAKYDVLLNDFEPVTAWASKWKDLSSISISHQAAFKHNVPKQGEAWTDRLLMRMFAPCDINLGVHWYHFGFPIIPPFIEESFDKATLGEHVLVYLPFENIDAIKLLLKKFPNEKFLCYHPDIEQAYNTENTQWRPLSKSTFQQALFECAGVIANGGFELSSECLQLGKKILVKPLKNQYEQSSNRITLERMDRCYSMDSLDADVVASWLKSPSPEPINYPNSPDVLIDWLLEGDYIDTKSLCEQLWKITRFPESVRLSLASGT